MTDNLTAILTASYEGLTDPDAQRLYRVVGGVHPGPDITAEAAAILAEITEADAARLLGLLAGAQLLQARPGGRYGFHDDVRPHAAALANAVDSEHDRRAAFVRLALRYRLVAVATQQVLNPNRWYVGPGYDAPPVVVFDDAKDALAWLETERDNLRAITGAAFDWDLHAVVWQITEARWNWYVQHRPYRDCVDDHALGLQAARECGDRLAEARMMHGLAWGLLGLGDPVGATERARIALALEQDSGHREGEATAREVIGVAHLALDQPDLAAEQFQLNIDLHHGLGRPRGAALNMRHLGEARAAAGRHRDAIALYRAALDFFGQDPREGYHQCRIRNFLARSLLAEGDIDAADTTAAEALSIAEEFDARNEQAISHVLLADIVALRGDRRTERQHLQQALDLYSRRGAAEAERIKQRLGELPDIDHEVDTVASGESGSGEPRRPGTESSAGSTDAASTRHGGGDE